MPLYSDFKYLNYWKTPRKISKLRELINRLYYDSIDKSKRIEEIDINFKICSKRIETLRTILPIEEIPEEEYLPDLIVSNIDYVMYSNYANIIITVKNIGDKISIPCVLYSYIGINNKILNIPALDINGEVDLTWTLSFNPLSNNKEYTITSVVDYNNANEESDETNNSLSKTIMLKEELIPPPPSGYAQIIVHCHNPEGKEINSITGTADISFSAQIFDGDVSIGYGTNNSTTHNQPIIINIGSHIIKVKFNGITLEQNINIDEGETQVLTFIFTRIEFNLEDFVTTNLPLEYPWYIDIFTSFPTYFTFDYWYVQSTKTGNPDINGKRVYLYIIAKWILVNEGEYHLEKISPFNSGSNIEITNYPGNVDSFVIKMASIPFDLLGTAV